MIFSASFDWVRQGFKVPHDVLLMLPPPFGAHTRGHGRSYPGQRCEPRGLDGAGTWATVCLTCE